MSKPIYMIFYDRGYRAQDNAEHLCRWVMHTHPEIKTGYILKASSYDWDRLKKEKFNLINAEDTEWTHTELMACDYACSSIFNEGINLNFDGCKCKRVFLNHGCFLVPISYIKQEADNIDLFIAANQVEHDNLLDPYHKLVSGQVALCGQPRQDELISLQHLVHKEDSILIQFWQRPASWTADNNKKFLESDFYKKTAALLSNAELLNFCRTKQLKLIFKMHSIQYDWLKYYKQFENDVVRLSDLSIPFEEEFIRSKMIITDISSNAYEMAKIGKPCIYFEPDPEFLFGWRYKKNGGFEFNLDAHGIGPLIYNSVGNTVTEIKKLVENNYKLDPIYIQRRKEQISFVNDANSCKRCFDAIMKIKISRTAIKTTAASKQREALKYYGVSEEPASSTDRPVDKDTLGQVDIVRATMAEKKQAPTTYAMPRTIVANPHQVHRIQADVAVVEDSKPVTQNVTVKPKPVAKPAQKATTTAKNTITQVKPTAKKPAPSRQTILQHSNVINDLEAMPNVDIKLTVKKPTKQTKLVGKQSSIPIANTRRVLDKKTNTQMPKDIPALIGLPVQPAVSTTKRQEARIVIPVRQEDELKNQTVAIGQNDIILPVDEVEQTATDILLDNAQKANNGQIFNTITSVDYETYINGVLKNHLGTAILDPYDDPNPVSTIAPARHSHITGHFAVSESDRNCFGITCALSEITCIRQTQIMALDQLLILLRGTHPDWPVLLAVHNWQNHIPQAKADTMIIVEVDPEILPTQKIMQEKLRSIFESFEYDAMIELCPKDIDLYEGIATIYSNAKLLESVNITRKM